MNIIRKLKLKRINKQIFIDTATNLFSDCRNILNNLEVQRVVRKEYGVKAFGRMIIDQNYYYPSYKHKLYGYFDLE